VRCLLCGVSCHGTDTQILPDGENTEGTYGFDEARTDSGPNSCRECPDDAPFSPAGSSTYACEMTCGKGQRLSAASCQSVYSSEDFSYSNPSSSGGSCCIDCGQIQGFKWPNGLRGLSRQHFLIFGSSRLPVQRWFHGAGWRALHGVRRRQVQVIYGLG